MAGSGAGGRWAARAWIAVAAAVLAGLLGWGALATTLGVAGSAGTSSQAGSGPATAEVACQSAPVTVTAVYAQTLNSGAGFQIPVDGFDVTGVAPGCEGMNLQVAVQIQGGDYYELDQVLAVVQGQSAYSLSAAGLPVTEPAPEITGYAVRLAPNAAAPTGLTASPGDGQAEIGFTAPLPGTSAITGYEYTLDGGATWSRAAGTASPITVTGLDNGTGYTLALRAVNAAGTGEASVPVGFTPRIPAPADLQGTAGNASATLTFTAPSTPSTITNWQYQADDGPWTPLSPADAASPVTITGLANNVAVQLRIRAQDANGTGLPSDPVTVTPEAADEDLAPAFVIGGGATGL